jgi:hypothetical protein
MYKKAISQITEARYDLMVFLMIKKHILMTGHDLNYANFSLYVIIEKN